MMGAVRRTNTVQQSFRHATKEDAAMLTELINYAGEGLPLYLWSQMAEAGQDPWAIGRERACREEGSFSYRNSILCEQDGKVVAGLLGYALPSNPDPAVYDSMPPMFVPLQQLEDLAPSTWYVNVLATIPEARGLGYGTALLSLVSGLAKEAGCEGQSIIVSDANKGAMRLYQRSGYIEQARRKMVKEGWQNDGEHWVLLTQPH